ncbi:MAG: hypothetical protein FJY98_02220 [Candidatus Liptonbacteria bacterium]|nr:hypothetical protein [Candidatus Liptonbacteria bacterium]
MSLFSIFYFLFSRKGQAALSFVFLVGSIVILVGVTLGFLTSSFVNSSFGYVAAQRALGLAKAGANDGYFQLLRNKDFSNTTGYNVPLGNDNATVTVTQNSPATGLVSILSTATISFHTRKVQVIASVASSTGQVSLVLWKEVQ